MKHLIFSEVDLPKIPPSLINFNFGPEEYTRYPSATKNLIKDNKSIVPCKYTVGVINYQPLIQWLDANLPWSKNCLRKIQTADAENSTEAIHAVHSDFNRRWSLNYMVSLGGDNVCTSWYKEKGKLLHRFKKFDLQTDDGDVRYENLEIIGSTKFENFKWYLMRSDILHDVCRINHCRTSVTISIVDNDFPNALTNKMSNHYYFETN
jgi:hypothetical protein